MAFLAADVNPDIVVQLPVLTTIVVPADLPQPRRGRRRRHRRRRDGDVQPDRTAQHRRRPLQGLLAVGLVAIVVPALLTDGEPGDRAGGRGVLGRVPLDRRDHRLQRAPLARHGRVRAALAPTSPRGCTTGCCRCRTSTSIPHVPVIARDVDRRAASSSRSVSIVGYPALRRRGLILGLITLAFAQVVDAFVFQYAELDKRPQQRLGRTCSAGRWPATARFLYFELVVLGLVLLLVRNLRSGVARPRARRDARQRAGRGQRRHLAAPLQAVDLRCQRFHRCDRRQPDRAAEGTLNVNPDGPFSPLFGLYWFGAVVVFGLSYRLSAILAAMSLRRRRRRGRQEPARA